MKAGAMDDAAVALMAAIPLVTPAHLALETVFAHKRGRLTAGLVDAVPTDRAFERV